MKKLAFLTVLVMILTLSFAFATEEPILTSPGADVTTANPEETSEGTENTEKVEAPTDGTENNENTETPTDGAENNENTEAPTDGSEESTTPDNTNTDINSEPAVTQKSNSTIVGAIIAIVIVVVVIALAALIQKK